MCRFELQHLEESRRNVGTWRHKTFLIDVIGNFSDALDDGVATSDRDTGGTTCKKEEVNCFRDFGLP